MNTSFLLEALQAWWRGGDLLMPVILLTGLVLYARIGTLAWLLICGVLPSQDQSAIARELILIRVLAAVLPLLGLLGTVAGMVETFAALSRADGAAAGAASGIGLALTATQYGIALAIPALLAETVLRRRAQVLQAHDSTPLYEPGTEAAC
jgi:hypothetical protein